MIGNVSLAIQGGRTHKTGGKAPPSTASKGKAGLHDRGATVDNDKVEAARFLMEKMVEERLGDLETRRILEQKVGVD